MTQIRLLNYAPWAAESGVDITSVDYVRALSIRLQPILSFDKGELTRREFFESAVLNPDGTMTGTNLVVREDMVYVRDTNGLVLNRTLTISWFNDDDTVALTKERFKLYTPMEALAEGKRFRSNLIDQLQINTLFLIMVTTGWDEATAQAAGAGFMLSIQGPTVNFVEADDKAGLVAAIQGASSVAFPWLDNDIGGGVTIRDYLVLGL